jgi:hypothetical protein
VYRCRGKHNHLYRCHRCRNPGSPFQPGDVFTAKFSYSPITKLVNRATITVEDRQFRCWADGTRIAYDNDPCHGSVFYQVVESPYVEIDLQAATPTCVVPPLEEFNQNNFIYSFNSFGHMTRVPSIIR